MVYIWRHLPKEITCHLSKRNHETAWDDNCIMAARVGLKKRKKYVFLEFLAALPVCFWIFFWVQNRSEVWCVPINLVWKLYLKRKRQFSLFLWLTSGLGKISLLGPETPNTVDLKTILEKNHLIHLTWYLFKCSREEVTASCWPGGIISRNLCAFFVAHPVCFRIVLG